MTECLPGDDREADLPNAYRLAVSGIAALTAVSPHLADFNETHIYNPRWTAHARFHAAQTMLLGTVLGGLTLAVLWGRGGTPRARLDLSAAAAAAFWATQAGALLFPGTAAVDPEFRSRLPRIAGRPVTQLPADAALLGLLGVAWWSARRAVTRDHAGRNVDAPWIRGATAQALARFFVYPIG